MIALIDGNNLAMRCWFKYPELINNSGENTKIIYGFLWSLKKLLREFPTINKVYVAWDTGIPQFRKELYPMYKHKEPHELNFEKETSREEVKRQGNILHELLPTLQIVSVRLQCNEADDIIAAFCSKVKDQRVLILSTDHDYYQLITNKVVVFNGIKEQIITENDLELKNKRYLQYRVLSGDSSDNLPGIKGIGSKTALDILQKYNSIEEYLKYGKQNKIYQSVLSNMDYINNVSKVIDLINILEYQPHLDNYVSTILEKTFSPSMDNYKVFQQFCFKNQFLSILENMKLWYENFIRINTE